MAEFAERTLGVEGKDHIRKRLQTGKEFARHILDAVDLESGIAFSYLPTDFPQERTSHLTEGGLVPIDPSTIRRFIGKDGQRYRMEPLPQIADNWVLGKVQAYLSEGSKRLCICEDWMPSKSDPFWLKPDKHREWATFVDEDVYYVLLPGDPSDRILWALRTADGPWPGLLAAMTTAPEESPDLDDRSLLPSDWRSLAENTQALVVGAYDGESLVLWTR